MRSGGCSGGLTNSTLGWCNAALGWVYPEVCQVCHRNRAGPDQCFLCSACCQEVRPILPPYCQRCGHPFPGQILGPFECNQCRKSQWSFSSARSAVVAQGVVREVIHQYKYNRSLWFEPLLAQWLAQAARPALEQEQWDWLVPVPLHPVKEREREFNQAERLARRLSAEVGIPLNTNMLRRVVSTPTQTFLSREERQDNVRQAFAWRGRPALAGKRIVVIDDVFTTGATTGACARVLRQAGAAEVCVWTVARGI